MHKPSNLYFIRYCSYTMLASVYFQFFSIYPKSFFSIKDQNIYRTTNCLSSWKEFNTIYSCLNCKYSKVNSVLNGEKLPRNLKLWKRLKLTLFISHKYRLNKSH